MEILRGWGFKMKKNFREGDRDISWNCKLHVGVAMYKQDTQYYFYVVFIN